MSKTYVITGATSGIGKALLERISSEGQIFAGYRNENLVENITKISDKIVPFYIDYNKQETIKPACDFILSKTNKIDTLVNIAGCVVAGPVEKIEINEIKRQFDVNVFGHLEFSSNLLDALEGGKIINISSMASFGIFPYISPYCASKKCLDMFFNSLLLESGRNIKIVSIKPGAISTPLWEKSIKENLKYIDNCTGYEKEMQFLIKNAEKNETNGLSVCKAVDVIMKADRAKNPKLSYTVGKDAFFASLISRLPQSWINKLVRAGLKLRINKSA